MSVTILYLPMLNHTVTNLETDEQYPSMKFELQKIIQHGYWNPYPNLNSYNGK